MEYAIYFEAEGEVCRLPVNPEELTRSAKMETEQYRVLSGSQIAVPTGKALEEISFDTEFPHEERRYTNKNFRSGSEWEKLLKRWQEEKRVVRFIAGNGIGEDISMEVLVTQVQTDEKAGEEGDKYISLTLLEYAAPTKRYIAAAQLKKESPAVSNPALSSGRTYTVAKGDTLWGIARKYYGNGSLYTKIYQANSGRIKNPNLIYPGQILDIPE